MSDNGEVKNEEEKKEEVKDFKIAEIWIRDGQIHLDAVDGFWQDKVRAIGLLEFCKDIVKNTPLKNEKKIMPVSGQMFNYVRSKFRRK